MNTGFKLIIAGGKTGGHLFPGIAVAQAVQGMCRDAETVFVGTNAPFEIQTLEAYGFEHRAITSRPVKGGSMISKAFSGAVLLVSLIQALIIMKTVKPDFVLGVGGFSSFAVVLAAWTLRIPTAIQEQNAFPGLTNRMLSRFAGVIFTSFKETKGLTLNPKVKFTGNPVRRTGPGTSPETIKSTKLKTETLKTEPPGPRDLDLDHFHPNRFTLLVTGGSQGAASINTAFMDALKLMDSLDRFNIIHQTGKEAEDRIQEEYRSLNIKATARAFFHNMPHLQDMADLVITRAGAGAVSELCIKGLPAILVPFPHAADDHQTFNARALVDQGACVMIRDLDLTGPVLKQAMEELINNKGKRDSMAEQMRALAMPGADRTIAEIILKTKDMKG
jgi:UDP-N-acetylglucosamine--N-acetylmuramyl-(pentapeptide) pyrophosphoryl-undecaprenol N-acetylglucosamine transferase